jgi:hypothetical protein
MGPSPSSKNKLENQSSLSPTEFDVGRSPREDLKMAKYSKADVINKTGDALCPICSTNRDWVQAEQPGWTIEASATTELAKEMFPASVVGLACTNCGFLRSHLIKEQ